MVSWFYMYSRYPQPVVTFFPTCIMMLLTIRVDVSSYSNDCTDIIICQFRGRQFQFDTAGGCAGMIPRRSVQEKVPSIENLPGEGVRTMKRMREEKKNASRRVNTARNRSGKRARAVTNMAMSGSVQSTTLFKKRIMFVRAVMMQLQVMITPARRMLRYATNLLSLRDYLCDGMIVRKVKYRFNKLYNIYSFLNTFLHLLLFPTGENRRWCGRGFASQSFGDVGTKEGSQCNVIAYYTVTYTYQFYRTYSFFNVPSLP